MSRKRREAELQRKQEIRKKRIKIGAFVLLGVCVLGALLAAVYLTKQPERIETTLNAGGDLVVPTSRIGSDKLTYIEYGGTHDLIAWRDGEGVVRTAFNTCEDCFAFGAEFSMSGTLLTCSYCGQKQSVGTMGYEEWGGCKPISIPPSYRADTGSDIVISGDVLQYARDVFELWENGIAGFSLESYGQLGLNGSGDSDGGSSDAGETQEDDVEAGGDAAAGLDAEDDAAESDESGAESMASDVPRTDGEEEA